MKLSKYKIFLTIIGSVVLFIVAVYVALNAAYFYKQFKFWLHPPKVETEASQQKQQPNQLSIPSLGIIAPIVEAQENSEVSFQEALKNGVVHYPGTAAAGQVGNMYIFGHSSDLALKDGGYKTVFALLPSIQNGAEIRVTDSSGTMFVYEVVDQFVASSTDVQLLEQETGGEKILTLQTSYPIGTALKRYIVKAKLK